MSARGIGWVDVFSAHPIAAICRYVRSLSLMRYECMNEKRGQL